jgi:parvulin-like peptidyl-prolyl isomerase
MPHAMPPQAAAETPEPAASEVIAYVGTRQITYGEFATWLRVMAGPRAEQLRKNPASRGQAQNQYLELQVLAAKGQKEKLETTKAFRNTLAALRMQAYARVLLDEDRPGGDMQKIKAKAENPPESELKAYFEANSERYSTPERFTARQILVGLKGAPTMGDKGYTEDEAKARLAKIQEELKAGRKFEDLAKEYSDDPGSKANGGLYKDIAYGRFAKEFEAAVRSQEIGKVGEPVKTQFGYHLILVESRSPKQAGDFEKVKDALRKQMAAERKDRLTREFIDQARQDVGFRLASAPSPAMPPMMPPMAPSHGMPPQAAPKP